MATPSLSIQYIGCPVPGILYSGISDGNTIDPQTGNIIPAGVPYRIFMSDPFNSYSCKRLAVLQSPLTPPTEQPLIVNPKYISSAVSYNPLTGIFSAVYSPPTGGASYVITKTLGQPWAITGSIQATIQGVTLIDAMPSGGYGTTYSGAGNFIFYAAFNNTPNVYFKLNIKQISYYGGVPTFIYSYIDQYNNIYISISENTYNAATTESKFASSVQVSTDQGATFSVLHAVGWVNANSSSLATLDFGALPTNAGFLTTEAYALVEPSNSGVLTLWGGYNYPVNAAAGSVSLGTAVNSGTEFNTVYPDNNVSYQFSDSGVDVLPNSAPTPANITISAPSSFPVTVKSIATDNTSNTIIVDINGGLYGVAASYSNVLANSAQLSWNLLDSSNTWKKVIFIPPTNDGSIFSNGLFVGICASGQSGSSATGTAWTLGTLPPSIVSSISDVTFDNGLVVIVGLKGYIAYTSDMVHWVVVNPVTTTTGEVLTAAIDFISVTP